MIPHATPSLSRISISLFAALGSLLILPAAHIGAATPLTHSWSVESSPNPSGNKASELESVSCPSAGSCTAVGFTVPPSKHQLHDQLALIEQLSQGEWSIVPGATVTGAVDTPLYGVSCPVTNFCVAVGTVQYGAPDPSFGALAESWNGTSWTLNALPLPVDATGPSLAAVSCPAQGSCVAVGGFVNSVTGQYRPLAERLDGSTWSVVPAPDPRGSAGNSEFTGIDCTAPTTCDVVGISAYNDTEQNVIAFGLNGSHWTDQDPVNPGPDPGDTDGAVSCSSAGSCTSVGSVAVIGQYALVEYWNGSAWVRQANPASRESETALYGVSCVGGSSCLAVGSSQPSNRFPPQAMAEVWNGTSWTLTRPVDAKGVTTQLQAVACTSPTACISVGSTLTTSSASTLVEVFSG
jgi:hypothetical protein